VTEPPRRSLREQQKIMTRERLVDGALEVFGTKGYPAATVDDIAAAAGASRATFYLHFKSKLHCLEALLFERLEPDLGTILGELDRVLADGSREDLRGWVKDMLRWCDEHQTLLIVMEQVWGSERKAAGGLQLQYTDYLPSLAERWPGGSELEARVRVWLLVNLISHAYLLWQVDGRFGSEVGEDLMVNVLADLWAAGLDALPQVR
jgi:AcrR family transcriptional regulator